MTCPIDRSRSERVEVSWTIPRIVCHLNPLSISWSIKPDCGWLWCMFQCCFMCSVLFWELKLMKSSESSIYEVFLEGNSFCCLMFTMNLLCFPYQEKTVVNLELLKRSNDCRSWWLIAASSRQLMRNDNVSSAPTERVVGRSAFRSHAVDGSEIRRSLVEIGSLSHYLQVFYLHPRCCRISEPSTVSVSSMKENSAILSVTHSLFDFFPSKFRFLQPEKHL